MAGALWKNAGMWEAYKQRGISNFKEEIGDRSGFEIFHFYACIFFGVIGIFFAALFALIFAAWLSVYFHFVPVQEAGEIAGNVLIGLLFCTFAFLCTKFGNKFLTRIGEWLEKSILQGLHALRVLPILHSSQYVKFIRIHVTTGSFISTAPFIPPRGLT